MKRVLLVIGVAVLCAVGIANVWKAMGLVYHGLGDEAPPGRFEDVRIEYSQELPPTHYRARASGTVACASGCTKKISLWADQITFCLRHADDARVLAEWPPGTCRP